MPLVATLISGPDAKILTDQFANSAARAVGASAPDWLAKGIAFDILIPGGITADATLSALRTIVGDLRADIAVQPAESRRKSILVADMDSTMIDQECIDELADLVGMKDHVAAITARSMNGQIAFEPALRERVALLRGLPTTVVDEVVASRITLARGGRELVATMNANGGWTALVSGGFTAFTSRIAAMLGFREQRANELIETDGRLAGTVREPILGREAKAHALRSIAASLERPVADAIAVGDGANDLDMLAIAGTGVALHAKPAVAERARFRIDHGDLTALLYLQGYRRSEFVS